jgi:MYXO-CTERM domain-containing protein
MDKWTTTGSTALTASTDQNVVPVGGSYSAKMTTSAARMHHNLLSDNGGAELDGPSTFTSYIYDGSGTATRIFNEVRGYSGGTGLPDGGTTASGSLGQLLAVGKYNTVTMGGEVYDGTKYQARVTFTTAGGTTAGWFNLNGPDAPSRSTGWHKFDIERLADGTTLNFYVDDVLSRTITGATAQSWDTVILGPGLGSTVGDAYIDGIQVTDTTVPEPAALGLLGLGGLALLRRRRA